MSGSEDESGEEDDVRSDQRQITVMVIRGEICKPQEVLW